MPEWEALFSCPPGQESLLLEELQASYPSAQTARLAPGWVASTVAAESGNTSALAFAEQVYPRPKALQAASIREWAELVAAALIAADLDPDLPWRLHIFAHSEADEAAAGPRRLKL